MERRIEDATKLNEVPKEALLKHNGFSQWDSYSSRRDHATILQVNFFLKHIQLIQFSAYSFIIVTHTLIIIYTTFFFSCKILLHKKDPNNSKDVDGFLLPTLVYLAREKRPQYHHNFKAGAMNSLVYNNILSIKFFYIWCLINCIC